jgi:hypothetical protein
MRRLNILGFWGEMAGTAKPLPPAARPFRLPVSSGDRSPQQIFSIFFQKNEESIDKIKIFV